MQKSPLSLRTASAAVAVVLLAACADATGPRPTLAPDAPATAQAPAHGTAPASVEWNEVARGLIAKNRASVFVAFRTFALTSLAQEGALAAAEAASDRGNVVSRRAAVAAASATVLGALFRADSLAVEGTLAGQLASVAWLERAGVDAGTGEAVGRAVGVAVLQRAASDGYADAWTGSLPMPGPGVWFSSATPPAAPVGASLVDARPFFLASPDQFRPAPPPAFGSPAFLTDLAEVRQISDTRTRAQDSIAKFWAMGAGTYTPAGYWNDEASRLALAYSLNEARATRLLALMNAVAFDAIIASNDAKYEYWLLRPSQADAGIVLAITPLPNFPAYPSNHATISAAMAEVLAETFPAEARRLRAAADEAALSRVYGGIHYRFDGDAGLALGRTVARYAMAQVGNVHAPYSVTATVR